MRETMSRRQFVRVTVAGVAGVQLLRAAPAFSASTGAPKPIPGGFKLPDFTPVPSGADIHVLPPAVGFEMSTITDFNGSVGAAHIIGTATGSDDSHFFFDADMRFMNGEYVGLDGRHHNATFGFV
jgi:hypothetical protein